MTWLEWVTVVVCAITIVISLVSSVVSIRLRRQEKVLRERLRRLKRYKAGLRSSVTSANFNKARAAVKAVMDAADAEGHDFTAGNYYDAVSGRPSKPDQPDIEWGLERMK